ncbi:cysteine desulfuration protein SufE [Pararhizobium capsulatum DSM 1112]|uniref:Cysteine desulfuration protein SufE n=2 Tax=Pararhizobium capsulatum TaxID=34014 RepID=A0ABU0BMV8_9HYPH|nr:cysteine desulfuration protein SufE [Pararhizobium capsulatum DSM 1112]
MDQKNTTGLTPLAEIIDNCAFLDDWQDRMSYVMELGRKLPEMPESDRTADNKVQGCASQVWLVTRADEASEDPLMTFEGESDAHIVRGLVAIVLSIFSGKRASDIAGIDALDLFGRMGLIEYLTAQRANGLRSMVKRIKDEAALRVARD